MEGQQGGFEIKETTTERDSPQDGEGAEMKKELGSADE
jgi:hypothetical protein